MILKKTAPKHARVCSYRSYPPECGNKSTLIPTSCLSWRYLNCDCPVNCRLCHAVFDHLNRLILTLSVPACFLSWFSSLLLIASCHQPRFPFPGWCRWTQPERDVGWLHRLLHHRQQALAQLVQVHFLPQGGAESCHGLGGVILAAVETAIDDRLDTLAQGLSDEKGDEGGEDDGHAVVL